MKLTFMMAIGFFSAAATAWDHINSCNSPESAIPPATFLWRTLLTSQPTSICSPHELAARGSLNFHHSCQHAELEQLLWRCRGKQVHSASNNPGPTGLVASTQACAVVAVEILVEEKEI